MQRKDTMGSGDAGGVRRLPRHGRSPRLLSWFVLVLCGATAHADHLSLAQTMPAESAKPDAAAVRVLPIEDAYRLALANEEQIKIAGRELAKAQLLPWRALAQLTPRADVTGTYTRNKGELSFFREPTLPGQEGTPSTIRPLESWQGIFAVTQPLVQPAFLPSWRWGKDTVQQNEQRYDFTVREVLFGVARAYYDVLRSQEQVRVSQDTLRLTQDELKQAEARFRVGEVTKTNTLNQVRTQLIDQTYSYQVALLGLDRAVGVFAQDYLPQR